MVVDVSVGTRNHVYIYIFTETCTDAWYYVLPRFAKLMNPHYQLKNLISYFHPPPSTLLLQYRVPLLHNSLTSFTLRRTPHHLFSHVYVWQGVSFSAIRHDPMSTVLYELHICARYGYISLFSLLRQMLVTGYQHTNTTISMIYNSIQLENYIIYGTKKHISCELSRPVDIQVCQFCVLTCSFVVHITLSAVIGGKSITGAGKAFHKGDCILCTPQSETVFLFLVVRCPGAARVRARITSIK